MPCAWDRLQLFLLARLQLFLLVNGGVDLRGDHTLLATGGETSDQNISFLIDGIPDLLAHSVLGALEVIPGVAVVVHEGEEVVVHPDELEVLALHVGHFHVVCGGADVLKLLASEDVKGDEMDLGVSVLASLRGGHLHNLAGPVLREDGDDCDDGDDADDGDDGDNEDIKEYWVSKKRQRLLSTEV
jgi:hypothetical protein